MVPLAVDISWAEKLTAFGTLATVLVLAISGILALRQLRDSERTRYAELLADLSRRWDEPFMRASRLEVAKRRPFDIGLIVLKMYRGRATQQDEDAFFSLQALPNFLETLGVIEYDARGLHLDMVDRLWGSSILGAWAKWERSVRFMRRRSGERAVYENFELLVRRIHWVKTRHFVHRAMMTHYAQSYGWYRWYGLCWCRYRLFWYDRYGKPSWRWRA